MICTNCGKEIADGSKFCPECGTKIEQKLLCPECGIEVEPGQKFCAQCGAKIENSDQNQIIQDDNFTSDAKDIDYDKLSIDELTKYAETGDAVAGITLGDHYLQGDGVEEDNDEAVFFYRRAIDSGSTDAQCRLGDCYWNGWGVEEDKEKAVSLYRKATNEGNTDAQWRLGYCYFNGEGVEEDKEKAVSLYTKAAAEGNTDAQCSLGNCYFNGEGVEEDKEKAVSLYTKAANEGDTDAQCSLGNCYFNGEGVEEDKEKAVSWYEMAANAGDSDAQYSLGKCYENGQGVVQDKDKAKYWYSKAAENGNVFAKNDYELLSENIDSEDTENENTPEDETIHVVESTEDRIRTIVDKYITDINNSGTSYSSAAVRNSKYSQVFQDVRSNIAEGVAQDEILGYVDTSIFGKGKAGLVFTKNRLYAKEPMQTISIPYGACDPYQQGSHVYLRNAKAYARGAFLIDDFDLSYYNAPALKDCLDEIIALI